VAHDVALAVAAAQSEGFFSVNRYLQYHRNHEDNTAMGEHRVWKLLNKVRKQIEIEQYIRMLEELLKCQGLLEAESRSFIFRKLEIMQERQKNLEQGKRSAILHQYLKNRDMVRLSTVVCDLWICRKGKE
jgi:hypothetical protein